MSRPIWKGHISFGLVYIPVTLYSAEKRKEELHFKLLDSRDNAKVRYERVNEVTGKPVPWDEVVKAYEFQKGHYVVLKEEDFKRAVVESSQTIEITHFIDKDAIDDIYFDRPYYLVPDKKGEKGFVLLREVLKRDEKLGVAKVVIRTKQYLAALEPVENALVLNLLRWDHELRKPEELSFPKGSLKTYKITPKEVHIAEQLVNAMTSEWDPTEYHDDYREALLKFIHRKEKGLPIEIPKAAPKGAKVIDFMELLKKSVAEKKGKHRTKTTRTARTHHRVHHRKRRV